MKYYIYRKNKKGHKRFYTCRITGYLNSIAEDKTIFLHINKN